MRRRTVLTLLTGAAALGTIISPPRPARARPPGPLITVAGDGTGDHLDVQSAVDAVPAGNEARFTIGIKPGVYAGQVIVPADRPFLRLCGLGADPGQAVIADDRANGTPRPDGGTWGTSGSASVTIDAADFSAQNLTFANTFDEAAHPEIANRQAVAVLTRADRLTFDRVRFLGDQDTLYVNSRAAGTPARCYLRRCYVEGDVDFIFGRATAVFDRCRIFSSTRGSTSNNGYVTAASTDLGTAYGLLFAGCSFTSDAAADTVYLGRPWHPSQDPNAIAQTVIRDSWLGAHIAATPWTDFGTWSWRDARYAEHGNCGPGAGTGADRPPLTEAQAAEFTVAAYLAGSDGWAPQH